MRPVQRRVWRPWPGVSSAAFRLPCGLLSSLFRRGGCFRRRCGLGLGTHRADRLTAASACSSVGFGALAADREISPMPESTVRTDVDQTADIRLNFPTQIAFDFIIAGDNGAELIDL